MLSIYSTDGRKVLFKEARGDRGICEGYALGEERHDPGSQWLAEKVGILVLRTCFAYIIRVELEEGERRLRVFLLSDFCYLGCWVG
jgi:hypothetical protein